MDVIGRLNRGQRVVILLAAAVILGFLVAFVISQANTTHVTETGPGDTITVPGQPSGVTDSTIPAPGVAFQAEVGLASISDSPMASWAQLLLVLGAAVIWLIVAVVVLQKP